MNEIDPIVEAVRAKLLERSQVGIIKYGTTLESNTKDNYLNHVQMELMDAINYIQANNIPNPYLGETMARESRRKI